MTAIDYDALSALVPGLEVMHEPDGRQVFSYGIAPGTAVEAEEHDGEAAVYVRYWNGGDMPVRENVRGRFPADATEDIAECVQLAIEGVRAVTGIVNAKFAELLALATDIRWSASFSDQRDAVAVYAKSERLPGRCGFDITLQTPTIWHVRPATSSLRPDEAAFWQRFSTRESDAFGGFDLAFADLAAMLPAAQLTIVLDGMRAIAARREESAFQDAAAARNCRAVIQKYDRGWACPIQVAAGQFEDPDHRLRVERLLESDGYRPSRCWVLREIDRYPRQWFWPGWWATRRAADDEGRRILAGQAARAAKKAGQ